MHIIWRGFGLLVPVVVAVFFAGIQTLVNHVMGDPNYWTWNYWPKALAAFVAGLAIWFLGRHLNKKKAADSPTPNDVPPYYHAFFFIPFEFWGIIIAAFAFIGYYI
jgi:hypothetical protein